MDYSTVTETPGTRVTDEALSMLLTRYQTAAAFSEGKAVLEVACGAGQGLGYLARRARRVIGGDYTEGLLQVARRHYGDRIPLIRLDAHALPFRARSFEVVVLYEALYYLSHPKKFVAECRRVLRDGGVVLICTANREWPDFNPSAYSTRYLSAQDLRELLRGHGFSFEIYGAFPASGESSMDRIVSAIRRAAIALHLIPKTMKGKEWLKRLFLGRLTPFPAEVTDGMAEPQPLVPLNDTFLVPNYKVLYAVGRIQ